MKLWAVVGFLLGFNIVWAWGEAPPQWLRTFDVGTLGQINALQARIEVLEERVKRLEK